MFWFIMAVLVVWFSPVGRAILGQAERGRSSEGDADARELALMQGRVGDRIADLEERIDDIERLLVQPRGDR